MMMVMTTLVMMTTIMILKGIVKQNLSMTMTMMTTSLSQLSQHVENDGDDNDDADDDDDYLLCFVGAQHNQASSSVYNKYGMFSLSTHTLT